MRRTCDVSFESSSAFRTQIKQHVDQILASEAFDVSDRYRRLLRYIVEETLDGRAGRLIGHTIGVAVFDRPTDFDAQLDPIVRVAAERLRQCLKLYYLNEGSGSKIRITIPEGGYVPTFKGPAINPVMEQAQLIDEPADGLAHINILPVEMAPHRESEDIFGRVLADEIVVGLARFFSVSIERDGLIATMQPPRDEALSRGVAQEYVLKSSLHFLPSSLRYVGCLTVEVTGDVVWDCSIDIERAEILTVSERVSDQIADEIFSGGVSRISRAIDAG